MHPRDGAGPTTAAHARAAEPGGWSATVLLLAALGVLGGLVQWWEPPPPAGGRIPASAVDLGTPQPAEGPPPLQRPPPVEPSASPPSGIPAALAEPACHHRDRRVHCVRWHDDQRAHPPVAAVSRPGSVYTVSADGRVRALSASDGTMRWETRLDSDGPPRLLAPAIGTLPVHTGRGLHLLEVRDGRVLGEVPVAADAAVEAVGGWLVVADDDRLEAWSVTGARGWTHALAGTQHGIATPAGAFVHDERAGTLARLSTPRGETRWTRSLPEGRVEVLAVHGDGSSYLGVDMDGHEPGLLGLDRDGGQRWRQPLPGPITHVTTPDDSGALAAVVAAEEGERLLLIDPDDGRTTASTSLGPGATDSLAPVLGGDRVAVVTPHPRPLLTVMGRNEGFTHLRAFLDEPPQEVAVGEDGSVLVADARGVSSWSAGTGRWSLHLDDARVVLADPPTVAGGVGVVAVGPVP